MLPYLSAPRATVKIYYLPQTPSQPIVEQATLASHDTSQPNPLAPYPLLSEPLGHALDADSGGPHLAAASTFRHI